MDFPIVDIFLIEASEFKLRFDTKPIRKMSCILKLLNVTVSATKGYVREV